MPQLLTVGPHETKTHLADLLRQVRAGQGFTITQRGEPVADLLPTGTLARRTGIAAAQQMQRFMAQASGTASCDVAALMNEGLD